MAHQQRQLALYLVDACTNTPTPAEMASCVRAVLDEGYRRAFATAGAWMQQLAASDADGDHLAARFAAISAELADLRSRVERIRS